MKKIIFYLLLILFSSLSLISCKGIEDVEVPKDKLDYVGVWTSEHPDVVLEIYQDGGISYHYKGMKKGMSVEKNINVPLRGFEGNNFIAGALGIKTTFVVSLPPVKTPENTWIMVVEGDTLTRKN